VPATAASSRLYQVHGATALAIGAPQDRAALPKADAVVSNTPGLAIGVLTADCTPVLFADPQAKVVAAAHAGWRGAVGGILEAAILEMERLARAGRRSAPPSAHISAKIYEVGPDFEAEVLKLDPATRHSSTRQHPERACISICPVYVAQRLARAN